MTVQNAGPTVAQEMAKFSGFSTNNGETVKADTTTKGPGDSNLSDEEIAAGFKVAGEEAPRGKAGEKTDTKETKALAAKVVLTDEESDAALDKARADAKLGDGEELTKEEEDEALLAALNTKKEAAKPPVNDRVKRAQEGRRRAEARASAAERKTADLERRLAALETGGKAPLTGDTKKANSDTADKEPDPKDFEFGEVDAKFIRALARYEAKQVTAETSQNQQTQSRTAAEERAQAEFTEKREAFEEAGLAAFDDFQEVVLDTVTLPKSDPAAWPLSALLRDLLFESDHGPALLYQLASDPKEARRIDKLSAAQQAAWFGRQEAKLSSETDGKAKESEGAGRQETKEQPQPRTVSRAPLPLNRGRGAGGNKQPSAATTDFAAFEAMANQQPARR
jgi:hypothetical protein